MLENKGIEKDRFSRPKGWTDRGSGQPTQANRLNRLGNRSIGCPCPVEVWSRSAKNTLFHPIASSSRLRFTPSRSRSSWGNGNLPSIKCSNGQWTDRPLTWPVEAPFYCFWLPSLETYKLRAQLHLWIR